MHKTPLQTERRFAVLRWSLASPKAVAGGSSTVPATDFPGRSIPCSGPLRWRMLLPGVCCSLGWPDSPQQPVHHWHLFNSNRSATYTISCFQ